MKKLFLFLLLGIQAIIGQAQIIVAPGPDEEPDCGPCPRRPACQYHA